MEKLSKEELLKKLDKWLGGEDFFANISEEDAMAYHQINHAMTVFYNVILPESKPIPKPKVTMAFVEKWAKLIDTDPHKYTIISLREMLKEMGIEVER